jgi:hypothetical protein
MAWPAKDFRRYAAIRADIGNHIFYTHDGQIQLELQGKLNAQMPLCAELTKN